MFEMHEPGRTPWAGPNTDLPLMDAALSQSSLFKASFFASLIWGSIGMGYFIYGKKQQSWEAMRES